MTFNAQSNNVKPVLFSVAFMVVVLFCLFGAMQTFKVTNFRHFSSADCLIYSVFGLSLFRIFKAIFLMCLFSFFCFIVFLGCLSPVNYTFFALPISLFIYLAFEILKQNRPLLSFPKFRYCIYFSFT